jgi:hypothetical protein
MTWPMWITPRRGWLALAALAGVLTLALLADLAGGGASTRELEQLLAARAKLQEAIPAVAPTGAAGPGQPAGRQSSSGPSTASRPSSAPSPATGSNPSTSAGAPPDPAPLTDADKLVARMAKGNPFVQPKGFQGRLVGVLGDRAYFEGQPDGFQVGQDFGGAKLRRLGPDWAELEFDGKPVRLEVFGQGGGGGPGPGGRPRRSRGAAAEGGPPPEALEMMRAGGGQMDPAMAEQMAQQRAAMMARMREQAQAGQMEGGAASRPGGE